jgi:pimeloyl-ACP methyl ester carboxylesterase
MTIRHGTIPANGIELHVAECGAGPLVLMCHGWPELWYSWRHQLVALAAAGFRAVAPDMRGFGRSSAPDDVAAYSILHNVGDMVALVAALGEKRALIVGHDWGAPVAWHAALMRPDVFPAVVAMSVPHRRRGPLRPLDMLRKAGKTDYYWIYFQEQAAEDEFARDTRFTLRRILTIGSGDTPRDHKMSMYVDRAQGFLGASREDYPLPAWLRESDLDVFADEYRRSGFRGGLNWYRNIDRNWELTAPWQDAVITQPALFIAGTHDAVITGSIGQRALDELEGVVPNVRKILLDGAGHWIQQERPEEVNAALIGFAQEHLAPAV